jgi:hypothetical protein
MCRIDGRVLQKVSKRERRDTDRCWGGCPSADSPAVEELTAAVAAAAASADETDSIKLKVFWGSLSRSQTG